MQRALLAVLLSCDLPVSSLARSLPPAFTFMFGTVSVYLLWWTENTVPQP